MAKITIKSEKIQNCTLQIKDGYNNDVAYTWSSDRKTISTNMVAGQSYSFTVTADDGYVFNDPVKISFGQFDSGTMSFTIHDGKKIATFMVVLLKFIK